MKKNIWVYTLLALYSIFILFIEWEGGQDQVRMYLTDIDGDVLLYAINTTICTVLLALSSYSFFLGYTRLSKTDKKLGFFFLLQCLFFAYLAVDERFMVHERAGYVLGIHDSIILLLAGIGELLILFYFRKYKLSWKPNTFLYSASVLFSVMIVVDAFGASKGRFRLSVEDLLKLWAVYLCFRYSFAALKTTEAPLIHEE